MAKQSLRMRLLQIAIRPRVARHMRAAVRPKPALYPSLIYQDRVFVCFCRRGAASRQARRGGLLAAGPPKEKKRPLGGQQAGKAGVAWGLFSPPGRPKAKNAPLG